jgi:hypothetical protein
MRTTDLEHREHPRRIGTGRQIAGVANVDASMVAQCYLE